MVACMAAFNVRNGTRRLLGYHPFLRARTALASATSTGTV